jgi:hypothetical protein
MSIVTLKKKTAAKYNNNSVNSVHGFSLNGTHRNQGYVGQTSLSRSLPRTLMKGTAIKGHGGCCGTYRMMPIVQSGVLSQENPNVVKPSVINTTGLIEEKLHCFLPNAQTGCAKKTPYNIVKPDNNNHTSDQGNHITNKAKAAIACDSKNHEFKTLSKMHTCPYMNTQNYHNINANICSYQKPQSFLAAVSHGEHLATIDKTCEKNDKNNHNPSKNTPLPTGS